MSIIIVTIVLMGIMNMLVIGVVFYFFTKNNNIIMNKLLQIEIVKKAETFNEAKDFGTKDIIAEQKLEKTITDVQEKAFKDTLKKPKPTQEELDKQKEESQWQDVN